MIKLVRALLEKNKSLLVLSIVFFVLNLALYLFILNFHNRVPFNSFNYFKNAHHYLEDNRISNQKFSLTNSLGQYDAQWYLKIANEAYPKNPTIADLQAKDNMDSLIYAFFPFYPLVVGIANIVLGDVEIAAFAVTVLFLALDFLSLYWVTSKIIPSNKVVYRSILLLFTFPFSIFFRSYFSEGIFLFLFVWFMYFSYKRKYYYASTCLALLNITKANVFLINLVYLYYQYRDYRKGKLLFKQVILNFIILVTPLLLWMIYVRLQTGSPIYFFSVRKAWFPFSFPINIFYNVYQISTYFQLRFHLFYSSQVEVLFFLIVLVLFIKSKKHLPHELWLYSFLLWIFPFLSYVFMSFSRYQIVLFPLFIYLAKVMPTKIYYLIQTLFIIGLFIISLYFINWYWIG